MGVNCTNLCRAARGAAKAGIQGKKEGLSADNLIKAEQIWCVIARNNQSFSSDKFLCFHELKKGLVFFRMRQASSAVL